MLGTTMEIVPQSSLAYTVLGLGLGVIIAYCVNTEWDKYKKRNHLKELRTQKQRERQEQLEDFKSRFEYGPAQTKIVKMEFNELCKKLHSRELKAKEVLEAFIAKAVIVTTEFNCVTEFIPQCFLWAEELDAMPQPKGPFHGLPFCVKDDHDIEGMDTTLGMSANLYKPKKESAVIVKVLQEAGAVPFCKTNLPQTTLSGSSGNPIFGLTLNPLNKILSPGGSSSGTACLVRAGGAPFGLGSDLGGSLRIPAHLCGVATLKSTSYRNSPVGVGRALEDIAGYTAVSGVMAVDVGRLIKVYKVLWRDAHQSMKDPFTAPIPWNYEIFTSKDHLRIGYFTSLSVFPAIGDTPETINWAKHVLEEMGHTLVQFELPNPEKLEKMYSTLLMAGRGIQLYDLLKHDEVSKDVERFSKVCFSPLCPSYLHGGHGPVVDSEAQKSEVLWKYLKEQRLAKFDVLMKMGEADLDLILSPVLPFPAPRVDDVDELIRASYIYTAVWNLLDFPAGVMPFGTESTARMDELHPGRNPILRLAKMNLEMSKNMPIGVQIVGKPFQEEMVLRVMNELEDFKQCMKATGHEEVKPQPA